MSMFEFDDKTKLKSLKILNFDVEKLELDKIRHVPMHQYRVATKENPMLYVENLQVCVALYAYSDNFGFASHINTVIIREDDFILNDNKMPIQLRRCMDLKREILEYNSMKEPTKIGLALGATPISKSYPTMRLIYEGIEGLIYDLNLLGIPTKRLEDRSMPEFILDSTHQKIILPKKS